MDNYLFFSRKVKDVLLIFFLLKTLFLSVVSLDVEYDSFLITDLSSDLKDFLFLLHKKTN